MTASRFSRRQFLAASACAGLAAPLSAQSARERLREFDYADVRLTGGPMKRQYDHLRLHYLGLDNDRLLKVYRQRAGLPAPGDDMGGWYDADGFVPGHTLGQYISGLARFGRGTGDPACTAKVRALVDGYAATLAADGEPFASPKAALTWPCYVMDKHEIGLLDAYRLAGIASARSLLPQVIRGAIPHIPDYTYDRTPNSPKSHPYDETYILSENLFQSWEATGNQQFFEMACRYLLDAEYFLPLAMGLNVLPGKHAYSHSIALSSAAKAYQVLGDRKYLDAIVNAWDFIEADQQYASGAFGPKEAFVTPHDGRLGDLLTTTRDHFETPCGCYAHVKLSRWLLRFTAGSKYGDGLERILYNTVLGARDPDNDGNYFYYSDYQAGARKGYYHRKWSCCSGTLAQGVADYPLNIYFHAPGELFVNLYAPSEVRWSAGQVPVQVSQDGTYPEGGTVRLTVTPSAPVEFSLMLRLPGWLHADPEVRVNGRTFDLPSGRGTFAAVRRVWKAGDTVDLRFPLRFRPQPVDDRHPDTVALMRGPLMHVAVDPPAGMEKAPLELPSAIRANGAGFRCDYAGESVLLQPFHTVQGQTYNTYFTRVRPAA